MGARPQKRGSAERTGRMRTAGTSKDEVAAYSEGQRPALRTICDRLHALIAAGLPKATSKVWHGSPVWFIDDNPVVGYSANAKGVQLLFWNGQAFGEEGLEPMGKHRAAQAVFADAAEIDPAAVRRWLRKAGSDVFDSRGFFRKARERARRRRSPGA